MRRGLTKQFCTLFARLVRKFDRHYKPKAGFDVRMEPQPEACEAVCYLPSQVLLLRMRCRFFDQRGNFLGPGDVHAVARAGNFDHVAFGACSVPAFEVGIDGSVLPRNQRPAGLAFPSGGGDDRLEIFGEVGNLGPRHERGLLGGKIGREVLMKLRGIEGSETVGRLPD